MDDDDELDWRCVLGVRRWVAVEEDGDDDAGIDDAALPVGSAVSAAPLTERKAGSLFAMSSDEVGSAEWLAGSYDLFAIPSTATAVPGGDSCLSS